MDWRLAGQAQTVILEFDVDGQPVVPDADPIKVTIWDNAGLQLVQYDFTQPVDAVPTQMGVVMDTILTSIASLALFETRYIRADYKYQSKPYFVQENIRLHRMIPMTANARSVRSLVGADHDELPDHDIDLIQAYVELAAGFGSATLDTALRRTDHIAMAANDCIALQAAIKLCPSLQSRLLKSEKADNAGYQRADMDFEKLEADLRAQLTAHLAEITLVLDGIGFTVNVPTLFVVTKQTDRLTGSDS